MSDADELANDIARLYSWAHVEDNPYRSFARNRMLHRKAAALSQTPQENAEEPVLSAPAPYVESINVPQERSGVLQEQSGPGDSAAPRISAVSSGVEASPAGGVTDAVQPLFSAGRRTETATIVPSPSSDRKSYPSAIAIYSLAGGVGKTTLCANLGRILCSMGERVLLVDSSGAGLLPFYFGSSDFRPGFRTFVDPEGQFPPMRVLGETEEITARWLEEAVNPATQAVQRVIFDLGPASMGILPQILSKCSVLLVPLLTDLNSILTVSRIESSIQAMTARGIYVPSPVYVFNLFEEQSHRDQQAWEMISRQCGERLLPVTIRYSSDLDDAIASRMTVADHAPGSEIVSDYTKLALWLRKIAPVRQAAKSVQRWTER
jgi:cellulose biosynthesis protein BcsQ